MNPLFLLRIGDSGTVIASTVTPSATGGVLAWRRFRDEQEVRRRRIAMGIIPPDEPAAEIIIEIAQSPAPSLLKARLRQLADTETRLEELDRLLADVLTAQRIAEEQEYAALLRELHVTQAQQVAYIRNQNSMAVLVMLGLS